LCCRRRFRDVSFPTQTLFSTSVPPEAARLIVAMATATARLRGTAHAVIAELLDPLLTQAPMRALLWSLCVVNHQDALPVEIAQTVAQAILAQLASTTTADLQVDEFAHWRASLLASVLTHPNLAPMAESAATSLLDDACAGRRPLLDVVLVLRRVVPLVRGAVPRLRVLLADRAALLHLFSLERVSTTPTAVESIVDVFASSGDALVPLADDLVRAVASSLADETLRPIALVLVRGVCLRLAGIDFVSPTRTPLLAALKPSLLPLLVQHIGGDGDSILLDSLVAVVAGSRDAEAAVALTCAAAQRDAMLFASLLKRWYRAFPDLLRAVLGAALDDNESAVLLELLARVAAAKPSVVGVAMRECVRVQHSLLIAQLALADEREAHALASFALLRSAFSVVDDETCDAFGDGAAHGQVHRVRAFRDALCQLRLAALATHAAELIKLFVAEVVLRDVEPNSFAMIVAADSLVALAAPHGDECAPLATSSGSSRLASALPQGSLLLAACERHKRARMHSGAASSNSASTLFSGKEFVKPAARPPRPLALATPPAYEAGDELSQHALDLLSRVCAADERRLGAVRSSLVARANAAAGIVPTASGPSNGGSGSSGSGGNGGGGGMNGGVPPTPAHEGATSAPPHAVSQARRTSTRERVDVNRCKLNDRCVVVHVDDCRCAWRRRRWTHDGAAAVRLAEWRAAIARYRAAGGARRRCVSARARACDAGAVWSGDSRAAFGGWGAQRIRIASIGGRVSTAGLDVGELGGARRAVLARGCARCDRGAARDVGRRGGGECASERVERGSTRNMAHGRQCFRSRSIEWR
jgi:hypothetical protein